MWHPFFFICTRMTASRSKSLAMAPRRRVCLRETVRGWCRKRIYLKNMTEAGAAVGRPARPDGAIALCGDDTRRVRIVQKKAASFRGFLLVLQVRAMPTAGVPDARATLAYVSMRPRQLRASDLPLPHAPLAFSSPHRTRADLRNPKRAVLPSCHDVARWRGGWRAEMARPRAPRRSETTPALPSTAAAISPPKYSFRSASPASTRPLPFAAKGGAKASPLSASLGTFPHPKTSTCRTSWTTAQVVTTHTNTTSNPLLAYDRPRLTSLVFFCLRLSPVSRWTPACSISCSRLFLRLPLVYSYLMISGSHLLLDLLLGSYLVSVLSYLVSCWTPACLLSVSPV